MSADGVALLYAGLSMGANVRLVVDGVIVELCGHTAQICRVSEWTGWSICILQVAYVDYHCI